ncbi:ABC transporter ATP-binding protein [Paenibacillus ginsengarvi]|uniref:ABC transporter ATP-binding protein n=1 Tax=Paenibacillus ginsengarvi TaxID=400777 RepID=A0A3B0CZ79_9BACL|nr:ABC transporter ATP-binding protein [Paenibacillus ginsengarvi]RKN86846.1 ABC transporter ATP-binding protein [Paenibacillus ginsengarvi]
MRAIEFRQFQKRNGDFALRDMNFHVEGGYITGLIGSNGSGKTTLIRSIMNMIKPDRGEVLVFGQSYRSHERDIKRRIGFVYDEDVFYGHLTIREMKRIIASFYPTWNERAFQRYLHDFGLPERKKIRDLSKGMKAKFALAAALAHEPELLLMDEPTSGLDTVFRRDILSILSDYIRDGSKTVLFSTHLCADLDRIADYIVYIGGGELRFSGTKEELLERYLLVKGPVALLEQNPLPYAGLRQSQLGFEALLAKDPLRADDFASPYVVEKPTLDDIVMFTQEGGHRYGAASR